MWEPLSEQERSKIVQTSVFIEKVFGVFSVILRLMFGIFTIGAFFAFITGDDKVSDLFPLVFWGAIFVSSNVLWKSFKSSFKKQQNDDYVGCYGTVLHKEMTHGYSRRRGHYTIHYLIVELPDKSQYKLHVDTEAYSSEVLSSVRVYKPKDAEDTEENINVL